MKKYIVSALTLILLVSIGCANDSNKKTSSDGLNWMETVENAVKEAKEENKNILVNFTGSDWCIWCKRLNSEVFEKDGFKKYAEENLILVKLDYPRSIEQSEVTKKYNQTMLNKYGVRGFPTILLLDKNGNLVNKTGYLPGGPENYVKNLKEMYQKS